MGIDIFHQESKMQSKSYVLLPWSSSVTLFLDYIACNFIQISCQLITMGQFAHWRINLFTSGCFNGIITINTVDALVSGQNYRLLPLLRSRIALFGEEEPPICTHSCYCCTTRYRFFVWGHNIFISEKRTILNNSSGWLQLISLFGSKSGDGIEYNVKIDTFLIVHIILRSNWQSSPSETTSPSAGDLWVWLTGWFQATGGN